MAKKKDNLYLIAGIGLVIWALNQRRYTRPPVAPQYPQPPRQTTGQIWAAYVRQIIEIYGFVKELWEPGGPFYNIPPEEIYDIVGPTTGRDDYV